MQAMTELADAWNVAIEGSAMIRGENTAFNGSFQWARSKCSRRIRKRPDHKSDGAVERVECLVSVHPRFN